MLMLTRIHAYKLENNRILFSYAHGTNFLLVGGHYDEVAEYLLQREMNIMSINTIASVFIPEWTEYYCGDGSMFGKLLSSLMPTHIIVPKWKSEKQFASRIMSYINQYIVENPFVDIQYVYDDFEVHDKDVPSISNNNIVILSKITNRNNTAYYAYRFESNGKWTTINLCDNDYNRDIIESDVVIFPTFDYSELLEMEKATKCLKANVYINYLKSESYNFLKLLLDGKRLIYNVSKNDVVVSRKDSSLVSCYYFEPNSKMVIDKRDYKLDC